VYRAQTTELQEEKEAIKSEIAKAGDRIERSAEFDKYSKKIVKMKQKDIKTDTKKGKIANGFDSDNEENKRPRRRHSGAYPTADGLSRPDGAFPVFQPAPSGKLRQYRTETQGSIQL
jgi:hypothetical protein